MKTNIQLLIGFAIGIPSLLILIGLLALLIKCLMKYCRRKAWDDINTLPKQLDSSENNQRHHILPRHKSPDRQPLYQSTTNNAMEISDGQISIPIDDNNSGTDKNQLEKSKEHPYTIVQIQRDRLNHLKEAENRSRPMMYLSDVEDNIQRTIDQVQKEFDESV